MSTYYVVIPVLGAGDAAIKMPDLVLALRSLWLIQTLPIRGWQALNPHLNGFPDI